MVAPGFPSGLSPSPSSDPTPVVASVPTVLILDGSGSMTQSDAPGPRIDAAKTAAHGLIKALPDNTTIGLQTYGTTTGSTPQDKPAGCQDVTTLIPLGPLDRDTITTAINTITPAGYTPISLALQTAANQLPTDTTPQAIVLVSDGEETCDTPPCDTATTLKHTHPGLTISTVGFKVEGPAADQLRCIADTTGGLYVQATNADQLAARLLATQNIDQAHTALTATGLGDINLGDTLTDIHTRHPDFPNTPTTGTDTVTITWRDCDYQFTNNTLQSITPHHNPHTIDGITTGTPITKAIQLYGPPLATTTNNDGTTTAIFDADPNTQNAYKTTITDYTNTTNTPTGTITHITLCQCKPHAGSTEVALAPHSLLTFGGADGVFVGDPASKIPKTYLQEWVSDGMGSIPAGYAFYNFRLAQEVYKSDASIQADDEGRIVEFNWYGTDRGIRLGSTESAVEAQYGSYPRGRCRIPGAGWEGIFYEDVAAGRFLLFVYDADRIVQAIKARNSLQDGGSCGFE